MLLFRAVFYSCPPGCRNAAGLIFFLFEICEDQHDTGENPFSSNTNIPHFWIVQLEEVTEELIYDKLSSERGNYHPKNTNMLHNPDKKEANIFIKTSRTEDDHSDRFIIIF